MRAFISPALSGVDSLVMCDMPAPGPLAPGQIRVALRAASINYRDLLVLSGALRSVTLSELIPCSDGATRVGGRLAPVGLLTGRLQWCHRG